MILFTEEGARITQRVPPSRQLSLVWSGGGMGGRGSLTRWFYDQKTPNVWTKPDILANFPGNLHEHEETWTHREGEERGQAPLALPLESATGNKERQPSFFYNERHTKMKIILVSTAPDETLSLFCVKKRLSCKIKWSTLEAWETYFFFSLPDAKFDPYLKSVQLFI